MGSEGHSSDEASEKPSQDLRDKSEDGEVATERVMIRTASRNLNMFPVTMKTYEVSQAEVDEMIRDLELMEEANANADEVASQKSGAHLLTIIFARNAEKLWFCGVFTKNKWPRRP